MLSRFKARLAQLDDPPPYKYLKTIALTRKEYHDIRSDANDRRRRGAMNTIVVSNADAVVRQAFDLVLAILRISADRHLRLECGKHPLLRFHDHLRPHPA